MGDPIEIRVPSDPAYLDWIHAISKALLDLLPLDRRKKHYTLVAISEGFTNAHIHGNQGLEGRSIGLSYMIDENFLRVDIEDEGILPIQNNIDELVRPVDNEMESGRGLGLIRKLMDESQIRFNPKRGNVLTMKIFYEVESKEKQSNMEVADGNHA